MARRSNAKGVAWVALVIALIALIFSWIAFTRTGTQLNDKVEQAVEEELETNFQTQPATTNQQSPETGTSSDNSATTTQATE